MRINLLFDIIFMVAMTLCLSCSEKDNVIGGPCRYHEIPGTAEILSVTDGLGSLSCGEQIGVLFNFIPDDSAQLDPQALEVWPLESISMVIYGESPSSEWIESVGLYEGTEHRCFRLQIYEGGCVPISYRFADIGQCIIDDAVFQHMP